MIDPKIKTLLTLVDEGSYTKTAEVLSLTQPAVSHHIRQLEEEFDIHIFIKGKHSLKTTSEGAVLIDYARKAMALSENVRRAIEDCRRDIRTLTVGITPTASDILVPQVLAAYCRDHPHVHIQIVRGTIKNINNMLTSYEIDFAIVDGLIKSENTRSLLLGTDYLGLMVAPTHPFAQRASVTLEEIQCENLVLRPKKTETRRLFEMYVTSHGFIMRDFNVMMEIDSVSVIKEIVMANLGISVMSRNACMEEERRGKLVVIPIENCEMVRPINLIYPANFANLGLLRDIRAKYIHHFA